MQSEALVGLLFLLTPALAIPQATSVAYSESSSSSDSSDSADSSDTVSGASLPADYISVLETAVPSSWEYEMMNPASAAAVMSAAAAGTYPAWYNDLPESIKAVVTALGGFDANIVGETGSMTTAASTSSSGHAAETALATAVSSSTGSDAVETQASTQSSATSGAASSHKSAIPTSASSTGGAPIATGGVAVGVAGAAGLLGLVLAL
ncbi:hypothetical protein Aspvir_002778 [Aspergillus viridinutans]|uniref:GPI anchored protein n=1 Tax=Aspergillus viridinutans TaxID=75553 RepID=A0A9P3F9X7_ASPVI|nr:uncharacterized protein Aspvir_002778 [Aspergillus viridinutans]GIK07123.1 hypothetical protein Aspvir_002778 [Aspergillus viridinutans]